MQTASPTEGAGIGAYSYWRGGGATEVVGALYIALPANGLAKAGVPERGGGYGNRGRYKSGCARPV